MSQSSLPPQPPQPIPISVINRGTTPTTAEQRRASFARRAESLVERVRVLNQIYEDETAISCQPLHPRTAHWGFAKYLVNTDKSGELTVTVQGDLTQQEKRAVFITVHDLGCNHNSFQEFVSSPCMTEIKERSCFIHIDVPGHADNAEALPDSFQFPSLQTLGEDLITVLDFLHVKYVIGLGEGAGANVLARFGLAHPSRVLGLVLINATGSAASVLQSFKTKLIQWKNDDIAQSAESFLMYHKFGHFQVISKYLAYLANSNNARFHTSTFWSFLIIVIFNS
ncbi:uncharacterized protein ZK1073.1 isoform X5 [Bactrocera dorsalis]|uniref:Uncharacterized protein ZK1073.1 isoform X5 n=1 Tax=Bactrocera dorsalis TaxID=27457 RepID=A0ABM3J3P0_BACDO|nr:uncharacterized protein ZK1073.1 isoform X5 [Bactrocera dorsalis]